MCMKRGEENELRVMEDTVLVLETQVAPSRGPCLCLRLHFFFFFLFFSVLYL